MTRSLRCRRGSWTPMKRPRPSVAPRLLASLPTLIPNTFLQPGPAGEAGRSPLRQHGGQRTGRRETWTMARPKPPTSPLFLGALSVDIMDADWSAGTSPSRPEHPTRTTASSSHDTDPEGAALSAARCDDSDEDIDFHFGLPAGDPLPQHPDLTAWANVGGDLARAPRRPLAAAKMLIRSGLRCSTCFLKTWVCLCNRAPRELDRRGTVPSPSKRYRLFCLPCLPSAVHLRPRAVYCRHPAHSGSDGVRRHRWLAAIPAQSAEASAIALHPRVSRLDVSFCHFMTWQPFMRYSYCKHPPSPRRAHVQPNRGPKSAPEPCCRRLFPLPIYRRRGVRVSPLSAGGEGLCKARSRLLNRPGQPAEGVHKQLGSFSCHCSTCSGHDSLITPSQSVPWGQQV